jgi:FKBP-type peptidyl-prolyl cis-trans isomerase FklB
MNHSIFKAGVVSMFVLLVTSSAWASGWSKFTREGVVLDTDLDRASYSIGMSLGQDFKMREMQMNPDLIAMGIRDALEGNEPLLSQEQAVAALQKLQEIAVAKQQEALTRLASKNQADGVAFLAENGQREGVVTTASGLQYEILQEGSGKIPKASDSVSVDYLGTFIDGSEFDSSYKRGEPANFSVEGIIPGWTEALLLMKEGAKWRLYVPADLAYGEQGAPPVIGPNSTLIFEVELKEILQ